MVYSPIFSSMHFTEFFTNYDDDDDDDDDDDNDNDDDDNRDDNGISTLAQLLWHWQWMVFIFSGPELSCHREEKQKETLNPIRQWGVP